MNANQPHETGPVRPRHWDFSTFFAGLLLLYMAILAGGAALRESVTIDEVAWLTSGLA